MDVSYGLDMDVAFTELTPEQQQGLHRCSKQSAGNSSRDFSLDIALAERTKLYGFTALR